MHTRTDHRLLRRTNLFHAARNRRGIDRTDWLSPGRAAYDACLDPRDYRPRP